MALVLLEGFDHYSTASQAGLKGAGYDTSPTPLTSSGRFGGGCIQMSSSTDFLYFQGTDTPIIWMGFAFYIEEINVPTITSTYFTWGIFSDTAIHVAFYINPSFGISVYRSSTLLGSTDPGIISQQTWHYIECYAKIDNSVGEVILKVDGGEELNLTNQDTFHAGVNTNIASVAFSAIYSSIECWYDDLYIDDAGFLGDIKVVTKLPDSDGTHTDFTPQGAGSHYVEVDDTSPDDDTTYVEGKDKGDQESFGIPTTGLDGEIVGVQLTQYAKKTDVATCGIKNLVRVGGTDYLASTERFLSTGYNFFTDIWENNPDTSNPWKKSDIDNAEFGVEITSLSTTTTTTTV